MIAASRSIIIDGLLTTADGSLGIPDQVALMSLLRDREPGVVLEIGTYNGATTRLIALNLPRAKIHTLDLPPDISSEELHQSRLPKDDFHLIGNRRVGEAIVSDPAITNVTQHYGDSATWDFSPVQGLDFVFIDGSHTYQIHSETRSAVRKRPLGGPPLSGTTSTMATTTSSAISPKWRALVCRCVTSHRPTWP